MDNSVFERFPHPTRNLFAKCWGVDLGRDKTTGGDFGRIITTGGDFGRDKSTGGDLGYETVSVIAHRGLCDENAPENSLGAFENAARAGLPIEFDVQMTREGRAVIFHDNDLTRMTGKVGKVSERALGSLHALRLGGTEYGIPSLDDVLDVVDGRVPLLVEIKNGDICDTVVQKMADFNNDWAVQSFDPRVVKWFKDNAPNIKRGQLSGSFAGENLNFATKCALKYMIFNPITKPDFINYEFDALNCDGFAETVVKSSAIETPLLLWGVDKNNIAEARKLNPDTIVADL